MSRSLRVAALVLACAALAPACLLNAGPIDGEPGGTSSTTTTMTGGTGGTTTGGGGTGGTGGTLMDVCGDGMIGSTEECDDGGTDPGDGCDADCKPESGWVCMNEPGEPSVCAQTCGGGTLDAGEVCDDGDAEPLDGCDAQCQVEAGWECKQPGNDPEQPSVCATVCGDGVVAGAELCDDGNLVDTDGCEADCLAVSPGWDCDMTGGAASCQTVCGDGLAVGAEACDDAGTADGDGCSAACVAEHMCNNGVVDPTEQCDGGPGCNVDCTLDPMSVCGKAFAIPPGDVEDATGVRTSFYENDNEAAGVAVTDLDVAGQSCHAFNFPVLHRYTTGNRPSIVTVEALDAQADNTTTEDKTVVWVYRDCPGKKDLEGCDDNGGAGSRSLFTTGFIPAQTNLYIVLAGEGGGMDKGPYRLQVTEQPVKLFYHESFGSETVPGVYPPPASLTENSVAPGAEWVTCVGSVLPPCTGISLGSHSGGAFGIGHATMIDSVQSMVLLDTPDFDLTGLQLAHAQYTYVYNDGAGNDLGAAMPVNNGVLVNGMGNFYSGSSESGRTFIDLPKAANVGASFVYDDGSSAGAGKFSVDDIYIYGY